MTLPSASRPGVPGPLAPRRSPLERDRDAGLRAAALGATAALVLAIGALFLISAHLLVRLGIDYEVVEGSFVEKIHPGTWLALLAFALGSLQRGRPFSYLDGVAARFPGLAIFFATWLLALIDAIVVRKVPLTPLIDSFALPMVLLPLLAEQPGAVKRRLAVFLHLVMLANALIGLYEFETGFRLIPYVEQGIEITDDWRSTALLGHPLTNAAITGVYALVLAVGGGRDMPALVRPLLLAVQLAAMVAFGGRVATLAVLPLLAWLVVAGTWRWARGARVGVVNLALSALAIPVVLGGVLWLAETGFFEKFADRFVSDNGSAEARVIMLRLLHETSWPDLILGADIDRVTTILYQEGIEFGIESFWVNFTLIYGLGISLFFFAGLFCFLRDVVKSTGRGTWLVLVFMLAVGSSSVSISAKSTMLGMIVALLLTMLRKDAPHSGNG